MLTWMRGARHRRSHEEPPPVEADSNEKTEGAARPLLMLLPGRGGLLSFAMCAFPNADAALEFLNTLGRPVGITAFWALHAPPADSDPENPCEVIVITRDQAQEQAVHVISFLDIDSANAFVRAEANEGLLLESVLLYWAVPISISHDARSGGWKLRPDVCPVPAEPLFLEVPPANLEPITEEHLDFIAMADEPAVAEIVPETRTEFDLSTQSPEIELEPFAAILDEAGQTGPSEVIATPAADQEPALALEAPEPEVAAPAAELTVVEEPAAVVEVSEVPEPEVAAPATELTVVEEPAAVVEVSEASEPEVAAPAAELTVVEESAAVVEVSEVPEPSVDPEILALWERVSSREPGEQTDSAEEFAGAAEASVIADDISLEPSQTEVWNSAEEPAMAGQDPSVEAEGADMSNDEVAGAVSADTEGSPAPAATPVSKNEDVIALWERVSSKEPNEQPVEESQELVSAVTVGNAGLNGRSRRNLRQAAARDIKALSAELKGALNPLAQESAEKREREDFEGFRSPPGRF